MIIKKSYYPRKKLHTLHDLADILGVQCDHLIKVSTNSEKYYRANAPKYKNDGATRQTYTVLQPLKTILCRIKNRIFDGIVYANFLFGSIKGRAGIKGNAKHLAAIEKPKALLRFDIKNFFPSIKAEQVKEIWQNFFRFSEPVAELLTKLVTLSGSLPQGAHTSSDLANLVFWQREHHLASALLEEKMVYTRYVDDISVTLNRRYIKQDFSRIIGKIVIFFAKHDFNLNKKKLKIETQSSPMVVNKSVVINNQYNSPSKDKIKLVRRRLHKMLSEQSSIDQVYLKKELSSIQGYLRHLLYINNNQKCQKMLQKAVMDG